MSFKQRVFNIIGPSDDTYVLGRIFDLFITLLILTSVIIVFTARQPLAIATLAA